LIIQDYEFDHDDRPDYFEKIKNETPEEREVSERRYYEKRVFNRELSDDEWRNFWKVEKVKLGYKD